jgi:propionate CoA-transferase
LELKPGAIVNLGYGIADGVANIVAEEKALQGITFCIEQGLIGGIPAKGDIFGACYNPDAMIDAPSQFDFFHGGGIDIAFLGMAQVDKKGNVNVSRFGSSIPGTGGFIDISQNAKKVVFCGTFTAGGLEVSFQEGGLKIVREGKNKKFVERVEQITYNGEKGFLRHQEVLFVTERAVFSLTEKGFELMEIAPVIKLEKDILNQMQFKPAISQKLKQMDKKIFSPGLLGFNLNGGVGHAIVEK